jgi:hypothetical protein
LAGLLVVSVFATVGGAAVLPDVHTEAEIKAKWELYQPTATGDIFEIMPVTVGPDYLAGKVNQAYLDDALKHLNFVRFVAGVKDDVVLNAEQINFAQHGAVLSVADGGVGGHFPAKPADMEQAFYDLGYKGTSGSNLGYSDTLPDEHVFGCMGEFDSGGKLGHRLGFLRPNLKTTGFGLAKDSVGNYVSTGYGLGLDWADTDSAPAVIAWPTSGDFPNGWMPLLTIWGVFLASDSYQEPVANDITVTIQRPSDGKTWTLSQANPGDFYVNDDFFGVELGSDYHTVKFRPGYANTHRGEYQVQITGLKTIDGAPASLEYTVNFFDLDSPYHKETPAGPPSVDPEPEPDPDLPDPDLPDPDFPNPDLPKPDPDPVTPPATPTNPSSDGGGGGGCNASSFGWLGFLASSILVLNRKK